MQLDCTAFWADVVQVEFIEKVCPEEYKLFMDTRKRFSLETDLCKRKPTSPKLTLEHLAFLAVTSNEEIKKTYYYLLDAFKKRTDLVLFIDWHDSKEFGSSLDGVDGEFWYVNGAYMLSPAGERYKNEITRETYVVQE